MKRILHLLLDARRPVILAGAGVLRSRATADLVRLAELVDVPVVAAWRRPDVFPNDHPLYLGMTGYFAAPTVHRRLLEADAILVLGCRLNEVASHGWSVPAPDTRWAHVDLEPLGARGGLEAPTIGLACDARTFVREARRLLGGTVLEMASLERRRLANAADRAAYEEAREVDGTPWDGPGVHPGRVVATLSRTLPPDAIVTTDAGHFGGWAARGLWLRRPGTYLGPTAGAMGYGLPAAIAASIASPGRPVVALVGDGGLGMGVAELETAVREGARPIVLVFDNERYGTIRDHQDRRALVPIGTDLGPVDWSGVAQAFGAEGIRVESDEAFEPALRVALGSRRPTVLHLLVDRRWVSVDRLADAPPQREPGPAAGLPEAIEAVTSAGVLAADEHEPVPVSEPGVSAAGAVEPQPAAQVAPETGAEPWAEAEPDGWLAGGVDPGPAMPGITSEDAVDLPPDEAGGDGAETAAAEAPSEE